MDLNTNLDALPLAERVEAELWKRGYYEGAPPPSTMGRESYREAMGPHRARLARFVLWQADTARALSDAEATRDRLTAALGVEPVTARAIDDLVAADASGFLAWARAAAGTFTADLMRGFERAQLERRLEGDRHTAEVARASLGEADLEVAILARAVDVLAGRHESFVRAAVKECVEMLGTLYLVQASALAHTFDLMRAAEGAAGHITSEDGFTLPGFDLETLRNGAEGPVEPLRFGAGPVTREKRAALWRAFADELATDPTADVRPYTDTPLPRPEFEADDGSTVQVYLHHPIAAARERYALTVAPAADLPEQDPPAGWLDASGAPADFEVTFRFGKAEVPANLGAWMLKRGLAERAPAGALR